MRVTIDPTGQLVEARGSVGATAAAELIESGHILIDAKDLRCFVWLNGACVSPLFEAALYYFICDCPCTRFAVYFTPDRKAARIFGSREAAIRAIGDELVRFRRALTIGFASRPVKLSSLSTGSPLQQLLESFSGSVATNGLPGIRQFLTRVLHNRYLVVEHQPLTGSLVLREVGLGYSGFDPNWSRTAAGRRLEEQADIYYGRWLAQSYREVLARQQPTAHEVDAAIFTVEQGRRRFAYRRLLLPFADNKGNQCLLSASVTDPAIDLERRPAPHAASP